MADLRREMADLKSKLDRRGQQGPGEEMRVTRLPAPRLDLDDLAQRLASFYDSKKLETQVIADGPTRTVQGRTATWRKAVGMSSAITVVLRPDGEYLAVEIGRAKWADKAAAGAAGMFVLWPLAITAAIGAFREGALPKETLRFISASLGTAAEPSPEPRFQRSETPPRVEPGPPPRASKARIDVNTATAEELAGVASLERLAASRIIAERDRNGPFADMGELAHRTRLPPHVVTQAGQHLTFGAARTGPSSGRSIDW